MLNRRQSLRRTLFKRKMSLHQSTMPLRRTKRLNPRSKKYSPIPDEVRAEVERRSGCLCEIRVRCSAAPCQHIHHRLPRSHGGKHLLDNLVASCFACHRHVHDHPAWAYDCGWLVRGNWPMEDPRA